MNQLDLFTGQPIQPTAKPKPLAEVPLKAVISNLPLFTGKPDTVTLPNVDHLPTTRHDWRTKPVTDEQIESLNNKFKSTINMFDKLINLIEQSEQSTPTSPTNRERG
jgi:hypothetical protein